MDIDRASGHEEKRFHLPTLDGAEMRSRWDILSHPPDVLITNYSMLNVMLMRQREESLFEATREWLAESPSNVFTLIVDELHLYRGTAGSEVSYLLRNLRRRLGLDERPEQVRYVAASASLDPDRDAPYLSGFFAADAQTFQVVRGVVRPAPAVDPADRAAPVADRLRAAVSDAEGGRPRSVDELATDLAGPGAEPLASPDLESLLLEATDPEAADPVRLRAHLFFRNIPGIWACSRPDCSEVETPDDRPDRDDDERRRVGRLYAQPLYRCGCGGRVLELLYCQTCGDLFLGGYTAADHMVGSQLAWYVVPTLARLEDAPDRIQLAETASGYVVYWPRTADIEKPGWSRGAFRFAFRRSTYDPADGYLRNASDAPTGWSFHVVGPDGESADLPAAPTRCPNCGDDWERVAKAADDPTKYRSPIRRMQTGFEKISQVLTDSLVRALHEDQRKLVLFSDSRQDAAKLAAGLEKRHYQDLIRQTLATTLATSTAGDLEAFERFVRREDVSPESKEAARRFRSSFPDDAQTLEDGALEGASDEEQARAATVRARHASAERSLDSILRSVRDALLGLGVNPGGPDHRLQGFGVWPDRRPWTECFDWAASPPRTRGRDLPPGADRLLDAIDDGLRDECLEAMYAGAGLDFETIGLAYATVPSRPGLDPRRGDHEGARGRQRAPARTAGSLRGRCPLPIA